MASIVNKPLVGMLIFIALDKNEDGVLGGDEALGMFKNGTVAEPGDKPENSEETGKGEGKKRKLHSLSKLL